MKKTYSISIITPAFNEEKNLPIFYNKIKDIFKKIKFDYEWIIIDDHSTDSSFDVIKKLSKKDKRVIGLRLSKNLGSHKAITAGINVSKGKCAIIMASDLQHPPESIPILLDRWESGYQVIWAVRNKRKDDSIMRKLTTRIFYSTLIHLVGLKNISPTGSDFLLIDRKVIQALKLFNESNFNIFSLLSWMGFKQINVEYIKKNRIYGQSGWTLNKDIKLFLDSIISFSYFPIRLMTYAGMGIAFFGFVYALYVLKDALAGKPIEGWSSLMIVILILGGFQLIMSGVLGEYLWRTLDESKKRPLYMIESSTEDDVKNFSNEN